MPKNLIYIVHHDDADGIASAAIAASNYYPEDVEIKFQAVNYGKESWTFEDLDRASVVWMVDFTSDSMESLVSFAGSKLIWIDHHKTAAEKFPDLWNDKRIRGKRSIEYAACALTWEFSKLSPIVPWSIRYIADRDIWKFEYSDTKAFCAGLDIKVKTPDHPLWKNLLDPFESIDITEAIKLGELLLEALDYRLKKAFERGTDIFFHGRARLVNTTADISELGEYIYKKPEYDLAVMWQVMNGMVVFSLRSNTVDCAKIAQEYGGGGHLGAAGFQITEIDFPMLFFANNLKTQVGCVNESMDNPVMCCDKCYMKNRPADCKEYQKVNECNPIFE